MVDKCYHDGDHQGYEEADYILLPSGIWACPVCCGVWHPTGTIPLELSPLFIGQIEELVGDF